MRALSGVCSLSSFRDRPLLRIALIGALTATLGLAACGRKGPLDPPPGASLEGEAKPAQSNSPSLLNPVAVQPMGGSAGGSRDAMETPKGPKKSIPLDVLLN